jgi:hypothetical protein
MFLTQIRSRSTRREGPRVTAPGLLVRAVLGPRRLEIFRVSDGDWQMHAVVGGCALRRGNGSACCCFDDWLRGDLCLNLGTRRADFRGAGVSMLLV